MQQEDYFKRQIDQLGKALANVLSKLMQLDSSAKTSIGTEMIEQFFSESLNVETMALQEIPENQFVDYIINDLKVHPNNLEDLAEVLIIQSTSSDNELSFLRKSKLLLDYVQKQSNTYSLELATKIKRIEERLA